MDILSYFDFEDAGRRLEDLETPVPVIDIDTSVGDAGITIEVTCQ